MIKVDQSKYPIVYIEVDGLATLEAMQEYNDEMDTLLAYAETQPGKFRMIYINDMDDEAYKQHKREKAAQKLSNDWLKQNKARIGECCVAIAMVTQVTGMMKMMRPIARRSMKRMMGAPGDIFFTLDEAEAWMNRLVIQASST
ncbi:MAG: hypothetical protein AAFV98_07480 [Chloroflexota bacterium]